MDHEAASDLLGAYALDACEEAECREVESHLVGCVDCAGEASRLKDLAGWIGVSEAITPAESLRCRVLQWADEDHPPPI